MTQNIFAYQTSSSSFENKMEYKFQNRYELSFSEKNFSQIKEDSMNKELSLRNNFREELFLQKRIKQKIVESNEDSSSEKIIDNLTISRDLYDKCNSLNVSIIQLKEILIAFNSNDFEQKYKGLVGLRKILCLENPPIQLILDMNTLPNIIQLLGNSPVEFQYESLWCLVNISTKIEYNISKIKYLGLIDKIISLLDHSLDEIKELALWNIENFCCDSPKINTFLIKKKLLNKIITILSVNNNEKIIIKCISIIRSLIKYYNKNDIKNGSLTNELKNIINIVSRIIMSKKYIQENNYIRELYNNSLYILTFLTGNLIECRESILKNGVLPYIIDLIIKSSEKDDTFIVIGCLKIIGNIISGNANQTQKALDYNIYGLLKELMFHKNKRIKKEANWIVSNIAAGTERNIMDLIDNDFLPLLSRIFHNEDKDIKVEAIWTLCNLSQIKKDDYIKKLLNQGLLPMICECLKSEESRDIAISLESLNNLLEYGKKNSLDGNNCIAYEIERLGMIDYLESLQYHPNEVIYEKALHTIETFFQIE